VSDVSADDLFSKLKVLQLLVTSYLEMLVEIGLYKHCDIK